MLTPNKSLPRLMICTPMGTEDVRAVDDTVVGRWQENISEGSGPRGRLLLEDFLNWSTDPKEIVRFTKLYAPVLTDSPGIWDFFKPSDTVQQFTFNMPARESPREIWKPATKKGGPLPGQEFEFQLESWRNIQRGFRQFWEAVANKSQSVPLVHNTRGDAIFMRDGKLIYFAENLVSFFIMEFLYAPQERLRRCHRPECQIPYFVARHLRQQYCSPGCAEWAQAQAKKHWWSSEGKEWLSTRKKNTRSKNRKQKGIKPDAV
jgi:hypothetical protein